MYKTDKISSDLVAAVVDRIEEYLNGHESRTKSTLAMKSGVSYSTLRRLINKDVESPNLDTTVVPILSVFMTPKEISSLVGPYIPAYASFYLDDTDAFESKGVDWEDLDGRLVLLSRGKNGISLQRIEKLWGQKGFKRSEYLTQKGILKEENGVLYPAVHKVKGACPKATLDKIETAARNFDLDNLGKGGFFDYLSTRMLKSDFEHIRSLVKQVVDHIKISEARELSANDECVLVEMAMFADILEEE